MLSTMLRSCSSTETSVVFKKSVLVGIHATAMAAAMVALLPYGMSAYRLESLTVADSERNIQDVRDGHRIWQVAGGICVLVGLIVIITNKLMVHHSPLSLTLHGTFGLLTVAGIVLQISIGWLKYQSVSTSGQKVHRWHGTSGLVVYTLGVVALLLGAREVISADNDLYLVIIGVSAGLVWLMVVLLRLLVSFPDSHEEFAYTKQ